MKRYLPRLLFVTVLAACLAAPATFAQGNSKASSSKPHKSTHSQGAKHHAKGHGAKKSNGKHVTKHSGGKAKNTHQARPA